MATIEGKIEAVEWLLEKGADPSKEDSAGYLPLHYAVAEGHMNILGKLSLISDVIPPSPLPLSLPLPLPPKICHLPIAALLP